MLNSPNTQSPLEIWGGVECSFVRCANHVSDQLLRTGHDRRVDDLERFAALGLRTLRYPVLWERHAGTPIDWTWADDRLHRLRKLGIRPIVGLLHHGCGPLPDGFLDTDFVDGLARFARAVAERYPWIDAYTPVNEPLTTARFSGLYGLWHPCRCDTPSFTRILLNQCQAIRAAMKAIRAVNPAAQLIQTEDIGKTHSVDQLAYQADLENERRWLSLDLLCGQLTAGTPMYDYLRDAGLETAELDSFVDEPCAPDLLGMNHYVTSERMLDDHLANYPRAFHGGNEFHAYADIPATRARAEGATGPAGLLRELWQRYRRPIAITEVQLACTREEQLRWLQEMWRAAEKVRNEGIPVRAVTAWALLGAYDWDSLLLETKDHYESGAFCVRDFTPRKTAVGRAIQSLASEGHFDHPTARGPGWWRRPSRLIFPAVSTTRTGPGTALRDATSPEGTPPLLIVGTEGSLRQRLRRACQVRHLPAIFIRARDLDLGDTPALQECIAHHQPWAVIVDASGHPEASDMNFATHRSEENKTLLGNLQALSIAHHVGIGVFSSEPIVVDAEGWGMLTSCRTATAREPAYAPRPREAAVNIRAGARPVRQGKNRQRETAAVDHVFLRIDAALDLLIDEHGAGGILLVPMGASVSQLAMAVS